jgi:hypothetical protein
MSHKETKELRLLGTIFNCDKYKYNTGRAFKIKDSNNKIYNCIIDKDFATQFKDYDTINCLIIERSKNLFKVIGRPFIDIPSTKDDILGYIHQAIFKIKDMENKSDYPDSLYDLIEGYFLIERKLISSFDIFNYINIVSSDYIKAKQYNCINNLKDDGKGIMIHFPTILKWWFNNICIRRLALLGLTKTQISKCEFHSKNVKGASGVKSPPNYNEIYYNCITKPLKMIPIPNKICEFIIEHFNLNPTQIEKECATIMRDYYKILEEDSHTCISTHIISRKHSSFLKYLYIFEKEYGTVTDDNMIYPWFHLIAEKYVARRIRELINTNKVIPEHVIECKYTTFKKYKPVKEQKKAINMALSNRISVITGGAGVGKTSLIREIFYTLTQRGRSVAVCSFTGKAVYRLNKDLKDIVLAETMDSMIIKYRIQKKSESQEKTDKPYQYYESKSEFQEKIDEPYESSTKSEKKFKIYDFDTLIIDEASMVATNLMYRFLTEFNYRFNIIVIGDINQLDPMGWGFFMKEIESCDEIPTCTLRQNHRVSITEFDWGKEPADSNSKMVKMYQDIVERKNINKLIGFDSCMTGGVYIHGYGLDYINDILLEFKENNSYEDIVCINPYKNDDVKEIIQIFQNVFFKGVKKEKINGKYWHLGEKVMMLKNNSKKGVMNGQDGNIVDINEKGISVNFDGNILFYSAECKKKDEDDLSDDENDQSEVSLGEELNCRMLAHSCCITTHKSQGSEYPLVLFHIPEGKYAWNKFLHRNLLYVSMSRSREAFHSLAPSGLLENMAKTKRLVRFDNLGRRITLSLF